MNRSIRKLRAHAGSDKELLEQHPFAGPEAWVNPGPNGERLSPVDGPSSLVLRLSMLLSRRLNRELQSQVGVSMTVVRLLVQLHFVGPSTLKQLIERTLMDKAHVSRTMASMVKSGYIGYSGPLKNPTRFTARTKAVLTPAGEELVERALMVARAHHLEVLQGIAPGERRNLYRVLRRLTAVAEAWESE